MELSETMDFKLFSLGKTCFGQPLANVLSLVSLQLEHLTVFWVLNNSAVACKFLEEQNLVRLYLAGKFYYVMYFFAVADNFLQIVFR